MAYIFDEPSRTFNEYLLVPGYSSTECRVDNVSLKTPVVRFKKGEEPAISMNIPLVSAVMQAVSGDRLAIALAKEGGISFIYGSQSIESQAEMVRKVKSHKAGFVRSDANIRPDQTLAELLDLKERTGHSTTAVTEDGTPEGKMVGLVTSRDYRISRTPLDEKVCNFMTPFDKLVYAKEGITLSEANDMLWDNKLNALPIVDENQRLAYFVFRKDYDTHKAYPDELLDEHKRYVVGAGVNTRDYAERIPALVEAGADVLCIDSSEGFTEWQKITLDFVREKYGDSVKIGAGNVVDREGFNFLADSGADFVKVGIGGGSICITREQKGIGRGQATAVIEVAKARDDYYRRTRCVCTDLFRRRHRLRLSHDAGAGNGRGFPDARKIFLQIRRVAYSKAEHKRKLCQGVLGRRLEQSEKLAALRHGRRQQAFVRGRCRFVCALCGTAQRQCKAVTAEGEVDYVQLRTS